MVFLELSISPHLFTDLKRLECFKTRLRQKSDITYQIMLNRKIAILCLSVSLSVKINLNENHLLSEIAPALSKFKNLGLKSEYFLLVIKFTNLIRLI